MDIQVLSAFTNNYMYLLADGSDAAIIDPSDDRPLLSTIKNRALELRRLLLTHHHADHTDGCTGLKHATNCQIIGPGQPVDQPARDGDILSFGSTDLTIMDMPGHSRHNVAYYSAADKAVFTGDTLFVGGCGRIFGGTPADLWQSLKRLRELPDDTRVYCGHEYTVDNLEFALSLEPRNRPVSEFLSRIRHTLSKGIPSVPSTIAQEKIINPFFRADSPEIASAVNLPGQPPETVFTEIRRLKDQW